MRIISRIKIKNETELCETDFKGENPFHLSVQKKGESVNKLINSKSGFQFCLSSHNSILSLFSGFSEHILSKKKKT